MRGSQVKAENHHLEAIKTYVEQTKLLVTLSSLFIVAPAAAMKEFATSDFSLFIATEGCFVGSVLLGYLVFGSISGSQDSGDFNVYRVATRVFSLVQFGLFLTGLILFAILTWTNAPGVGSEQLPIS